MSHAKLSLLIIIEYVVMVDQFRTFITKWVINWQMNCQVSTFIVVLLFYGYYFNVRTIDAEC